MDNMEDNLITDLEGSQVILNDELVNNVVDNSDLLKSMF